MASSSSRKMPVPQESRPMHRSSGHQPIASTSRSQQQSSTSGKPLPSRGKVPQNYENFAEASSSSHRSVPSRPPLSKNYSSGGKGVMRNSNADGSISNDSSTFKSLHAKSSSHLGQSTPRSKQHPELPSSKQNPQRTKHNDYPPQQKLRAKVTLPASAHTSRGAFQQTSPSPALIPSSSARIKARVSRQSLAEIHTGSSGSGSAVAVPTDNDSQSVSSSESPNLDYVHSNRGTGVPDTPMSNMMHESPAMTPSISTSVSTTPASTSVASQGPSLKLRTSIIAQRLPDTTFSKEAPPLSASFFNWTSHSHLYDPNSIMKSSPSSVSSSLGLGIKGAMMKKASLRASLSNANDTLDDPLYDLDDVKDIQLLTNDQDPHENTLIADQDLYEPIEKSLNRSLLPMDDPVSVCNDAEYLNDSQASLSPTFETAILAQHLSQQSLADNDISLMKDNAKNMHSSNRLETHATEIGLLPSWVEAPKPGAPMSMSTLATTSGEFSLSHGSQGLLDKHISRTISSETIMTPETKLSRRNSVQFNPVSNDSNQTTREVAASKVVKKLKSLPLLRFKQLANIHDENVAPSPQDDEIVQEQGKALEELEHDQDDVFKKSAYTYGRQEEEAETIAKLKRQIMDLEITRTSILAVSTMHEKAYLRQRKELRELRKSIKDPLTPFMRANESHEHPSNSAISLSDGKEVPWEDLLEADPEFASIAMSLEYLVERGKKALQVDPSSTQRGHRVLQTYY